MISVQCDEYNNSYRYWMLRKHKDKNTNKAMWYSTFQDYGQRIKEHNQDSEYIHLGLIYH